MSTPTQFDADFQVSLDAAIRYLLHAKADPAHFSEYVLGAEAQLSRARKFAPSGPTWDRGRP